MKKALIVSIATIALCVCIIAGATYALFTSEQKVNVAVTAGKVNIVATLSGLKTYSKGVLQSEGTNNGTFEPSGTATLSDTALEIDRMAPLDKATLIVNVANNSDIAIKYKVRIYTEAKDGTTDLAPALVATAKVGNNTYAINGDNNESAWIDVEPRAAIGAIEVAVEFPNDDDYTDGSGNNDFQSAYTKIYVQIIAIQGNGSDIYDATTAEITTAAPSDPADPN